MAKVRMQINIVKSDTESNTVISLCKMSEKAYAEINPEVWAAPGKYGKLDIEPLQITLKKKKKKPNQDKWYLKSNTLFQRRERRSYSLSLSPC